ncbi:class II aldolase and adducin N-terminal domain-containing protein [Burkholderia sp. MR1-5-21]
MTALCTATASHNVKDEVQLRQELAAAFRLAVRNDWHESVANHFSLAVSPDGKRFLMNPRWKHFSRIKASDLLLLDAEDPTTMEREDAPDPSAWAIHGRIHAACPEARCILHAHSTYGTVLASLADPEIKPIDQNTARFFNRTAIDLEFGGVADDEDEANRLVRALGNKKSMIMGNHGVIVTAATVAEAYDELYFLEKSCRTLVLAYSTNKPLNVMSDALAEKVATEWGDYREMAFAHFAEMRVILDEEEPSYAD